MQCFWVRADRETLQIGGLGASRRIAVDIGPNRSADCACVSKRHAPTARILTTGATEESTVLLCSRNRAKPGTGVLQNPLTATGPGKALQSSARPPPRASHLLGHSIATDFNRSMRPMRLHQTTCNVLTQTYSEKSCSTPLIKRRRLEH